MPSIHHYEELIAGRLFKIEASEVRSNRWRAQITRRPGTLTALMPFYGTTPDEAAQLLRDWLTRAYRSTPPVV
jgi:hypothetical protein